MGQTKYSYSFCLVILLLLSTSLSAQQKFPVTGTTMLVPPYSTYLNDYISPGSGTLKFNFVFNDFREASWQVRLKIRIESVDLKLETRPEFKPPPLIVTPGVLVSLSGSDFAEYFDYKNLSVLGASAPALLQNGRLPEGNYTFCIEVLDYPSGIVLSNTSCANAWIRLSDPPRVISPLCGAYIDPTLPLNIPFQWQLFNAVSPNATLGTEYRLVIYQMTDPYANPFTAIANGKVLQIFESDPLIQTTFNYNISLPALDIGGTYVYQIRAKDVSGRDTFKNNGLSEVCWFHYGYPENGKIKAIAPEPDKNFRRSDLLYFKWSAPDLRIKNQPFVYELKIAPVAEGQTLEQAIEDNAPWHVERTIENTFTNGMDLLIRKPLKKGLNYVWQVTAFSGKQTVAKSEIQKFSAPPIIDRFYAGNHVVVVLKANNNDSLNFSGLAKFRSGINDSIEVAFEHLQLKRIASYWVLNKGNLISELRNPTAITLEPRQAKNGNATFYPRTVRLDKDELALEGEVNWQLPHATKSGQPAIVKSERSWLNYDQFKLLGAARLTSQNQFDLLDPMDFTLKLSTESDFLISGNKFELRLQGNLQVPERVKGKLKGKVSIPFPRTGQLFYLDSLAVENSDFAPMENTRIYLHPKRVCIDLSEEQSPGGKSGASFWKGVYVYDYDVQYNSFTDKLSQLRFKRDLVYSYSDQFGTNNPWVDATGLNFIISKDFNKDTIQFNSFFGRVNHFDLTVEKNKVLGSSLSGEVLLPVFSATDFHPFTIPVTDEGLQSGYLDDFEGKSFIFNKGAGEQEMLLTVKRGIFEEHRLLNFSLQIEWPALNITARSVNGFKIWSDYRIGFDTPNGTIALDNQLQGTLNDYPITVDAISAGSNIGFYSIAISSKAQMGDDVSGQNGPPSLNVFSIIHNSWAPAGPAFIPGQSQPISGAEVAAVQQDFTSVGKGIEQTINANSQEIKDKARETLANITSETSTQASLDDATKGFIGTTTSSDEIPESGGLLGSMNAKQRGVVKEIVTTIVAELIKPLRDSINGEASKVNDRIKKELDAIVLLAQQQVKEKVTSLVFSIAGPFMYNARNSKVDLSAQIEQLAAVIVNSVSTEVNNSIKASINGNITTPFTNLVQVQIADRVNNYIKTSATQIVIGSLEGTVQLEDVPQTIVAGVDTVLRNIANKVFDQISFSSLSSMVENTATDILKGIDTDKIVREIEAGVKTIATNTLADEANKVVATAASDFLRKQIGIDVPINFTGLAKRLVNGQKLFSLDSVNVRLKTQVLELNGFVYYKKDQPQYGNVWLGDIDVTVKHPKPFALGVTYLNGRTVEGTHYWFAQISPSDDTTYKLGDVMPKKARELQSPVTLGVAQMVGVSGRVYRHMKDASASPILPDATNDYGAYLNLILYDNGGGKSMRLDVAGEYVMSSDKNYIITFDGNIQLMNKSPKVLTIDPEATVKGVVQFSYNSSEEHFLGYGRVEVLKPGKLCATGSVLVDTKPGKWRVEVGSREDRITFIPGCVGWSPTGWLAITQSEAELGLGLQYSIHEKTPDINFIIVKANIEIDAGLAAGIVVGVQYKPDFLLLKAGIWADLWADLLINYKKPAGSWKSISLLSIYARGDLTMYFQPPPTMLEGSLKGSVRLLSIVTIDFDHSFKKKIS